MAADVFAICIRDTIPSCIRAKNRVKMVADKDSFAPWFEELRTENPLNFPEYEEKLKAAQEKTGLHEALTIDYVLLFSVKK